MYFNVLNIESGKSVTINKVLKILLKIENLKNIKILYDESKPTMLPKRLISISKIKNELKYRRFTTLKQGLKKTLNWYKKNYDYYKNTI